LFEAAKFHVRQAGLLGEGEQQKANVENEILKTQMNFLSNHKADLGWTLLKNSGAIIQSLVTAEPRTIELSGNLGNSLHADVEVGGVPIPSMQLFGALYGGGIRTDIAAGGFTGLTGVELEKYQKYSLGGGIAALNLYGMIRGANSEMANSLEDISSKVHPLGPTWKK
jgi:hypothetical protein